MNLDKLLSLYRCLAKKQANTLPESSRITACQWIQKLEAVPATEEHEKKVLLHALKLLLLSLERKQLVGPFEDTPEEDKAFTDYNWHGIQLNDFVNMVNKKDLDMRGCAKFSYAVSGNRRELATFKNDSSTGQHCYYACSSEPIERWDNLEAGAIPNDTVETWRQHGEWDVLNEKGSGNSSIDVPRCQPPEGVPDVDFVAKDERCDNEKSNYYCMNQNVPEKTHQGHPSLRTPKRLGGTIPSRQYCPEEFGLNQNEQFRSPRTVFENSEYDQCQIPRGVSMPDRLTDSKKKEMGVNPTSMEDDTFKDNLRERLQNIRNRMNQPAEVDFQQQSELNPDVAAHYERILLHEPIEEYEDDHIEDDVHSLGILSSDAMYDGDMFGAEQTVDPNSIFKNENVNLVSRNVMKLETNTKISGNERKVTEEFLEREDINLLQNKRSDNDLMNTNKQTFESPSGGVFPISAYDVTQHRPKRSPHRPRQIPVDKEDSYQRNESALQDDHGQSTKHSDVDGSSKRRQVLLERANQSLSHGTSKYSRHTQKDSSFKTQHHKLPQVDISERLTDIGQPSFPQSFDDYGRRSERNTSGKERRYLPQVDTTERLDDVYQPEFPQSFEDSRHISEGSRRKTGRSYLPQVDITERLTDVCQPNFHTSYEEYRRTLERSSRRTGHRYLPKAGVSEQLEDVCQPDFSESFQDSKHIHRDSGRKTDVSRLPQVDISERLTDVCQPSFPLSCEESKRRLERSRLPQVDVSERLEDVYQPDFPESFQDSRHRSEDNRRRTDRSRLREVNVSERLTDVCQPSFPTSYEDSTQKSESRARRAGQRDLPQVDVSERLEDVYQPEFPESFQDSRHRSEDNRRRTDRIRLREVDVSERLTDVCQPSFPTSYEDSTQKSESRARRAGQRDLPQVDVSERLEDVYQPDFPESFQDSRHISEDNRRRTDRFAQLDVSERLTDVCQPSFPTSYEDSTQKSERRVRRVGQRDLPQVDVSERLEDVYQPEFPESFQDSRHRSEDNRRRTDRSRLREVDVSERLTDVCQPSFPTSYEDSTQKSERRVRRVGQRDLPQVDVAERLEDVYQPDFPESFQDSRHISEDNRRRTDRFAQVDVSERLTDVCQPSFPTSYEDSTQKSERRVRRVGQRDLPQVDVSERLEDVYQPDFPESFQDSRHRSDDNKRRTDRSRLREVDVSERLTDVCQPSFPTSYEDSTQKSESRARRAVQRDLPQVDVSERLEDVYQPEFPESFQNSRHISEDSRRRTDRFAQVDVSERLTDVGPPSFSTSHEESRRRSDRSHLPKVDSSERLTDVCQPSLPTSFEESKRRSGQRHLPQVDVSEMLDDGYQPNFWQSVEDSGRNVPQVDRRQTSPSRDERTQYLKTSEQVDHVSKPRQFQHLTEENLDNISEPVFLSDHQDSTRRSPDRIPLHSGNSKDVSQPSPRQRLEASLQRGPPRIPFPKKDASAAQSRTTKRVGDYKEPFRSMANYAPFQQQINPECCPPPARAFTTKLKLPGTFTKNVGQSGEVLLATSTSRIPPPTRRMQQQARPHAISRPTYRSKSPCETFRLMPPISRVQMQHNARPQTVIPRLEQIAQIAKPNAQEHLIKKSTMKIQVTKSTYSKDQQRNRSRKK